MHAIWHLFIYAALLGLAQAQFGGGPDDAPSGYGGSPTRSKEASSRHEGNRKKYADDANVLVLPGLLSNKTTKRVEILAEATGLAANSVIEFLIIDQTCGRGYESLLWSYAKPSDVHRALVFIGMKPGTAYNADALQFWPKGERVFPYILTQGEGAKPLRLEKLILDKTTGTTLAENGIVFTGSYRLPANHPYHPNAYAADVIEPKSIGSVFNHRLTVLDVPARAPTHEVYGKRLANPENLLAAHDLVTLILEPEFKDDQKRVRDLKLTFTGDADKPVTLIETEGNKLLAQGKLPQALAAFQKLSQEDRDAYVVLDYADQLSLAAAKRYSQLIKAIDTDQGIRVEPPLKGQLFYEAFSPRPDLLDRENRFAHPWELELEQDASGSLQGNLLLYEFAPAEDDNAEETLTFNAWKVSSAKALKAKIETLNTERAADPDNFPVPNVIFVHAPGSMAYGTVTSFIADVLPEPSTVYVFPRE